ncbi:MAG: type II toxin-antitoxin system HicA family toxin [Armatimonadetes bacterium]|nr:type II toxin-antitoxin system HicA family toxin [Armatimonadota bacterium]
MNKIEELLERFLSKQKDFSYSELEEILNNFNYKKIVKKNISNSRISFFNKKNKYVISLDNPDSQGELKIYQLDYIEEELKNKKLII